MAAVGARESRKEAEDGRDWGSWRLGLFLVAEREGGGGWLWLRDGIQQQKGDGRRRGTAFNTYNGAQARFLVSSLGTYPVSTDLTCAREHFNCEAFISNPTFSASFTSNPSHLGHLAHNHFTNHPLTWYRDQDRDGTTRCACTASVHHFSRPLYNIVPHNPTHTRCCPELTQILNLEFQLKAYNCYEDAPYRY